MLPAEFISHCGVIADCQLFSKLQIVEQMLLQLAIHGCVPVAELPSLTAAVMRREGLGTTGIGRGVACPHTRHAAVQRSSVAAFLFKPPVQFDSIDAEPADIFLLYLSPPPKPYERMGNNPYAEFQRQFTRDDFLAHFQRCQSGQEIHQLLCSSENAHSFE